MFIPSQSWNEYRIHFLGQTASIGLISSPLISPSKTFIYKALFDFLHTNSLSFFFFFSLKGDQSKWQQRERPPEFFPEGSRAAGRFSARKKGLLRMSTSRKLNKRNWRSLHARDLNQKKRQEGQ